MHGRRAHTEMADHTLTEPHVVVTQTAESAQTRR